MRNYVLILLLLLFCDVSGRNPMKRLKWNVCKKIQFYYKEIWNNLTLSKLILRGYFIKSAFTASA